MSAKHRVLSRFASLVLTVHVELLALCHGIRISWESQVDVQFICLDLWSGGVIGSWLFET